MNTLESLHLRAEALLVSEHPHLDWASGAWRWKVQQLKDARYELCVVHRDVFIGLTKANRAVILSDCLNNLQAQPLLSSKLSGNYHRTVFRLTQAQAQTEVGWLFRNLDEEQLEALDGLRSSEIWPIMSRSELEWLTQQFRKYNCRRTSRFSTPYVPLNEITNETQI